MKKLFWMVGLSFALSVTLSIGVQAQLKEVQEQGTTTYYVTAKFLPLGEGRLAMSYEATGLTISDTGEGLFHQATVRVLGGMTIDKGVYKNERAWAVWNLQNGDKVFSTYTGTGEAEPGGTGTAKGTVTFTGGTGKCTNIQGTFEGTRISVRPAMEGIFQSYGKGKIQYKLP
jgi:hypothetical protein